MHVHCDHTIVYIGENLLYWNFGNVNNSWGWHPAKKYHQTLHPSSNYIQSCIYSHEIVWWWLLMSQCSTTHFITHQTMSLKSEIELTFRFCLGLLSANPLDSTSLNSFSKVPARFSILSISGWVKSSKSSMDSLSSATASRWRKCFCKPNHKLQTLVTIIF